MDQDIFSMEKYIVDIKQEVMGLVANPGGDKVKHDSLVMHLHSLMEHIQKEHKVREGDFFLGLGKSDDQYLSPIVMIDETSCHHRCFAL